MPYILKFESMGDALVRIVSCSKKPEESTLYRHHGFGVRVSQVLNNGVVCSYKAMDSWIPPSDRNIFVKTARSYADGDSLGSGWYLCSGRVTWKTVLGAQQTLYAFDEISEEVYRKVKEEHDRFERERMKAQIRLEAQQVQSAAAQGQPSAMAVLGWFHHTGAFGVKKDVAAAVEFYRKAAERQNEEAQFRYAVCLANGWGVERNPAAAVKTCHAIEEQVAKRRNASDDAVAEWRNQRDYSTRWNDRVMQYLEEHGMDNETKELVHGLIAGFHDEAVYRKCAEQGDGFAQYLMVEHATNEVETAKWHDMAAKNGFDMEPSADAQYRMAEFYARGTDVQKYKSWLTKAAERGHVMAQRNLGQILLVGVGGETNFLEAAKWFRKASEHGDDGAQMGLGIVYEHGLGVETNLAEAVRWYTMAAEQTNYTAMCCLARVSPDEKAAEEWCRLAANAHIAHAQYMMGMFIRRKEMRKFEYRIITDKEVEWFVKAAKQGHVEAQRELAECFAAGFTGSYLDGNEYCKPSFEDAVKWYTKAAEQGDAIAQCRLGECKLGFLCKKENRPSMRRQVAQQKKESLPVPPSSADMARALEWFKKSADNGCADGEYWMGRCYSNGWGVETNHAESVKWYRKAAEQGHSSAKSELADAYESGHGLAPDKAKAAELYRELADKGDAKAQNKMGLYCWYGQGGLKADKAEAEKWLRRAAEQKLPDAQCNLADLLVEQAYDLFHNPVKQSNDGQR